ncbi:MAG: hypothetical protein R3C59_04370 [Planctomycetaceae bacterium]
MNAIPQTHSGHHATGSSNAGICGNGRHGPDGADVLPQLLSKTTVCKLLDNVTPKHVENLVRSGRMPEPSYLGRSPRWNRTELLNWIHSGCPVLDAQKLDNWNAEQAVRKAAAEQRSNKGKAGSSSGRRSSGEGSSGKGTIARSRER